VTEAVSCPPFTNTVGVTGVPYHWIFAPETNPLPFTVSVNAAPPAVAEAGLRLDMIAGAGLIVKVLEADVVPSLLNTATNTCAAEAIIAWVTGAVSCVAFTNVVANAFPFHMTAAFELKPVPFTVSVNALSPAVAEAGLRLEMPAVAVGHASSSWCASTEPSPVA